MHEDPHIPTDGVLAATEEALAASYRAVFDALDEAFCVIEMILDDGGSVVDYRFLTVNRAFEGHTGLGDVLGRRVRDVLPQLEPIWFETFAEVARSHEPARFVEEVKALRRWFAVYAWPLVPQAGPRVAVHFTDITERRSAEDAFLDRSQQFRTLVHKAPLGVVLIDVDFRIAEANPMAHMAFGDVPDLVGRDYDDVVRSRWPLDRELVPAARRTLATGVSYDEPELAVVHADRGLTEYYDWRMDRIRLPDGRDGIVGYVSDVTERKRAELALQESVAMLRHLAHHDALTGLPNRLLFEERLREAVANADRHGRPFAVLFLDLEGVKETNDGFGHASGDAVLVEVARRLRRVLRASDMLARLHGNEFAFILPEMSEAREAGSLAQKLLELVRGPIDVAATTVQVRASIGVALYPIDGAEPRALLRAADDAMHRAKLRGKDAVSYVIAAPDGAGRSGAPS